MLAGYFYIVFIVQENKDNCEFHRSEPACWNVTCTGLVLCLQMPSWHLRAERVGMWICNDSDPWDHRTKIQSAGV